MFAHHSVLPSLPFDAGLGDGLGAASHPDRALLERQASVGAEVREARRARRASRRASRSRRTDAGLTANPSSPAIPANPRPTTAALPIQVAATAVVAAPALASLAN